MSTVAPIDAPQQGQMVEVRTRRWIVAEVEASSLPPDLLAPGKRPEHLVTLRSVEDDAEPDESLRVVWEIEPGARVIEAAGLPTPTHFDDPALFSAFLDAVRWAGSSASDQRMMLAPFQSGIDVEAYQLEPLAKALKMPRVSLLIADDVGLGKTIEAGLVVQEMLLRYRARRVLIVAPADLTVQWRDEMRDKFGLEFRIVDSALVKRLRREQGIHANPWTHYPRLITSVDYLKTERPMRRFRETLPGPQDLRFPRRWDLLIVDEAHNVAPSGGGRYARASQRTQCLREIIPHVEHRLFLTATPHNGYDESFEALLELLDDQRFARGVAPESRTLREVMVRRLKSDPDIATGWDGTSKFPVREIAPIEVDYPEDERAAHANLRRYTTLRTSGARDATEATATEFVLKLLKKRLLSSPIAFAKTLAVHRRSIEESRRATGRAEVKPAILQRYLDTAEQPYDLEDEREQAEDAAHEAATRTFRPLTDEEAQLLDALQDWAERASASADAKANALIAQVEEICRTPEGEWNDERLIIFTEYRDTQKWLFELLAGRGLTGDGRVQEIWGGMDPELRAQVKAAFQADPAESPIRVLIGTDAASEGINLQRHCHRVLHYEIPWNPNRLEQRNGRVDRHGQRSPTVLVMHFVPRGWEDLKHLMDVPVGKLDGDLEFLRRVVEKVNAIRERLGKVGPVIAEQVSEAMLGKNRRRLDTDTAEAEYSKQARILAWERRLREELRAYQDQYDETRADLQLTPDHIQTVVATALELAGQPALIPTREPNVFRMPPLTGTWARCTEGLPHPFTGAIRPITFDPLVARDRDDIVLCHLGHRLSQMAVRLLRAEVFQPPGSRLLQRATAVRVDDPHLAAPLVAVYARLVIVGAAGHRLHEEVIQAGGHIEQGRLVRAAVTPLRDALALPVAGPLTEVDQERVLALHPSLTTSLVAAVQARANERARDLQATLARRADEQANAITTVLEELGRQIDAELGRKPSDQLALFEEQERQRDRHYLGERLARIPEDIERETTAIRERYRDPEHRVFPIAVEYRLPAKALSR